MQKYFRFGVAAIVTLTVFLTLCSSTPFNSTAIISQQEVIKDVQPPSTHRPLVQHILYEAPNISGMIALEQEKNQVTILE